MNIESPKPDRFGLLFLHLSGDRLLENIIQ
jgi:hypothetical protein